MDEIALARCPYCGDEPELYREDSGLWQVICDGCGKHTDYFYTAKAAIEAWNAGEDPEERDEKGLL